MKQTKNTSKLIAIAFLMLSGCVITSSYAGKEPTIVKTFNLNSSGELEVETSGGWIHVEGVDGDKVEVQTFISRNGTTFSPDDPELDEILLDYDFSIEMNSAKVSVYARKKSIAGIWNNISISFKIFVPHDMTCNLNTSGGGLKLLNVNGIQNLNTSGGGIELANIHGDTKANTSGGGIRINNLEGLIDVKTSGGKISITDGKGDIKASTSGGGIHMENIYGKVDCHTSGGGIHITGIANSIKASTSGGGIHVNVTGLNKELHLSTSGGGIHANIPSDLGLDLDLGGNKVNIEVQNFTGKMEKNRIKGSMNGGGIPVYMHTSGGNVDVEFEP